jgi:hypothetical protein
MIEIYTSINKMDGGLLVTRTLTNEKNEQKIFTNLNKAIAWIKEVLIETDE